MGMLLGDRSDVRAIHSPSAGATTGPMPVIDVHVSTKLSTSTAESVSFTSGANSLQLSYSPILSSKGNRIGKKGDTSLSFAAQLTTEVEWNDGLLTTNTLASGEFAVHYETGYVAYNSPSTVGSTVTYKYRSTTIAGSGAEVLVDDSAFTPASSSVAVVGFMVDDTATDSVDEGDAGAPRMSADRVIYTQGAVAHDAVDSGNPFKMGFKAVDPTSLPSAVSASDRVNAVGSLNGETLVYKSRLDAGEDLTNDVQKVEQRFSYISQSADGQVKAGAGFIHTLSIAAITATPTAGLVTVYDSLTETGTAIYKEWVFATDVGHTVILDASFTTGCYVGFDATLANVNITTTYR